jgi:hypothetical protein
MSVRPEIFQDICQKRLELYWKLLNEVSDMQFRIGETLIQHILQQKEVSTDTAKKLQDDLSEIRGKIVALQQKI